MKSLMTSETCLSFSETNHKTHKPKDANVERRAKLVKVRCIMRFDVSSFLLLKTLTETILLSSFIS